MIEVAFCVFTLGYLLGGLSFALVFGLFGPKGRV